MAPNSDFEPQSQSFNPFTVNEELQNNEPDPVINYYLDQISSLDTKTLCSYLVSSRTN